MKEQPPEGFSSDLTRARLNFDFVATVKNAQRAWWEKLLGKNKVTKYDIAEGYAAALDDFLKEETGGDKDKTEAALIKWHIFYGPGSNEAVAGRSHNAQDFVTRRDKWIFVTRGRISAETINTWPETKEIASTHIEGVARLLAADGVYGTFKDFLAERDAWIDAGVISFEEANALPGVQEAAHNDIRSAVIGYPPRDYDMKKVENKIKQWVGAGIIDERTARLWILEITTGEKI